MREKVLELFEEKNEWTLKELEMKLKLSSSKAFVELIKILNQLEEEHILFNNHTRYMYLDSDQYFVGKVKDISRFEYMVRNAEKKVYVVKKNKQEVFEGDIVLVQLGRINQIKHVYEHTITHLTGSFYKRKNEFIFYSDIDYHCTFEVTNLKSFSIRQGYKAVVQIVSYARPLKVKIVEMLGHEKDAGVDISSLLYANQIRMDWNDKVSKDLKKIPSSVVDKDFNERKDLRDLLTFTIDGDDAKDFDDAISIEKNKQGYILYVHIADVSNYVKEGSAIDQEAFLRSTSVYVCDRVVPMLPFELSNGICSLNPNVDRCTLTCKMFINSRGRITSYEIFPSMIHSDMRCTYHKVNQVLDGEKLDEYDFLLDAFTLLKKCCLKLQKQADKRGSIEFETSESELILNEKGRTIDVRKKTRGFAEQMIEECMISANVCVANYLHSHDLPCMYRIHEKPDPAKLFSVLQVANVLGASVAFDCEEVKPKDLQEFLSSLDEDQHDILSMVSLRAMQKARYDEKCIGHFGLALSEYCHFTSPIRRYSDLVVHRMLRKYVFHHESLNKVAKDKKKIEKQAFHISEKEREAIRVERLVNDYKKAEYMKKYIGKTYNGRIVGVQSFGFFVELENTVEGLVPVHTLYDDFYVYDELKMQLKAECGHRSFQMGQKVKVICTGVDEKKGQVEFALRN